MSQKAILLLAITSLFPFWCRAAPVARTWVLDRAEDGGSRSKEILGWRDDIAGAILLSVEGSALDFFFDLSGGARGFLGLASLVVDEAVVVLVLFKLFASFFLRGFFGARVMDAGTTTWFGLARMPAADDFSPPTFAPML